jgi:hypothetical protein
MRRSCQGLRLKKEVSLLASVFASRIPISVTGDGGKRDPCSLRATCLSDHLIRKIFHPRTESGNKQKECALINHAPLGSGNGREKLRCEAAESSVVSANVRLLHR